MNIESEKQKLIAWCNVQVGTPEGANNYNKYAAMPEMRQLLGWDAQNQPWCNIFVNAAFIACFGLERAAKLLYQPIGKGSALCSASAQFFKTNGAWQDTPQPGDVVFFNVNGGVNHMGVVTVVGAGAITTVEGNSSDKVARRSYVIGSAQIAGYGRPNWAVVEDPSTPADASAQDDTEGNVSAQDDTEGNASALCEALPVLSFGCCGRSVVVAQGILIALGYSCGPDGADGDFGYNTRNAVKNFQRGAGISEDGTIGPNTWEKLLGL